MTSLARRGSSRRQDVRADFARLSYQGFGARIDVGDLPVLANRKANGGLFVAGMIEEQALVEDDLHPGIDLLDRYADWHRVGRRRKVVVDVDDIFAGNEAAHFCDFLAD